MDDWSAAADRDAPDDLRERILTGFKDGKPFTPYVPTLALPLPAGAVLDFGCGLGRNFPYLNTIARHVTGYDLPPMIDRCRALAPEPVGLLSSDWAQLRAQRFDLVFATLVLQHIPSAAVSSYLADFARMAPVAYFLSRGLSDDGANVIALIAAADAFHVEACVAVEHDPETHQLRVLGAADFVSLQRIVSDKHYELRLRSR